MTTVYFIASHTNPDQVVRLARTIRGNNLDNLVVIHHDQKAQILPNINGLDGVYLYPERMNIEWGNYSQVQLFLDVSRWVLEHFEFDWLVFISGQDYPIRPIAEIERGLATALVDVMLEGYLLNAHPYWTHDEGHDRYFFQYYRIPKFRYAHRVPTLFRRGWRTFLEWVSRHQPLIRYRWMPYGLPARFGLRKISAPFSDNFPCWGGPQWGNFSRKAIRYLLDFNRAQPAYFRHCFHTLHPDESCIHSVLFNAARTGQLKISHHNLRYVHWRNENKDLSPQTIFLPDLDKITRMSKSVDFARKFDEKIDHAALDKIDQCVHR